MIRLAFEFTVSFGACLNDFRLSYSRASLDETRYLRSEAVPTTHNFVISDAQTKSCF